MPKPNRPLPVGRRARVVTIAATAATLALFVALAPTSGCAFGGRKAQLQDRKNTLADELRDLVPAVLAAKKKARPILAKRRLGNTAMSMRGGVVDGATFNFTSTHAGIKVRGKVTAQRTGASTAASTIVVSKSKGKRGRK